jgi:hypothetical protein
MIAWMQITPHSVELKFFRGGLASIRDFLVLNSLTFIQPEQTGFDGRDVNKNVFPAALRLDEPIPLFAN